MPYCAKTLVFFLLIILQHAEWLLAEVIMTSHAPCDVICSLNIGIIINVSIHTKRGVASMGVAGGGGGGGGGDD